MRSILCLLRPAWKPVLESLEGRRLLSVSIPNAAGDPDFGDAPDVYQTLLASNGPRHLIVPSLFLGNVIDGEPDGQPSPGADRDDLMPVGMPDDEDGVVFLDPLIPGANVRVQITNGGTMPGFVDAWIDHNINNTFLDPGDVILTAAPLPPGTTIFNFTLRPNAVPGSSYARFRLSNFGQLPPFGPAGDGEVEDYKVVIQEEMQTVDWGDAPDVYQTLAASNGPSHPISLPAVLLGQAIDGEPDGQPSANADRDDLNGVPDDEDGVTFLTQINPGGNALVQILNGGSGINFVSGWMDFNANNTFNDATDALFIGVPVNPGPIVLPFAVPANAVPGMTYARFRISTMPIAVPFGPAPNGEVEDYRVTIESPPPPMDFGDAPDSYGTLLASNGPRHPLVNPFLYLGGLADPEPDGQPSTMADFDDLMGVPDDEDGITFLSPLMPGVTAAIQAVNGAPFIGVLDGWIDFNGNGTFLDPGEKIALSVPLNPGPNVLSFTVPVGATWGPTYARFRLSTLGGLSPLGPAVDGEVEDYRVIIEQPADFGDAPSIMSFGTSFPTLIAENGPQHAFVAGMPILGVAWDAELNGIPSLTALGDDLTNVPDDEDGVLVNGAPADIGPFVAGQVNLIVVNLGGGGGPAFLNAWLDLNQDGDWIDAGEQVALAMPLMPGANVLPVFIPSSQGGQINSRFRVSTMPALPFSGPAPDGEVEDYNTRVLPDVTGPIVTSSMFEWDARQAVQLTFNEPLNPLSVQAGDLLVLNLDDGTSPVPLSVTLSAGNTVATWVFSNTTGSYFSDGDYRFTLSANAVSDPVGNGNSVYTLQGAGVYYFAGDATRDRSINISDFSLLAANFNKPGTCSSGDFDYSGTTNIGDFAILASKFNTVLPAGLPRAASLAPARTPFASKWLAEWDVEDIEEVIIE